MINVEHLDAYVMSLRTLLAPCGCEREDDYRQSLCSVCLRAAEMQGRYHCGSLRLTDVNVDNVARFETIGGHPYVVLHRGGTRFRAIQLLPLRHAMVSDDAFIPVGQSEVFIRPTGLNVLVSFSKFWKG